MDEETKNALIGSPALGTPSPPSSILGDINSIRILIGCSIAISLLALMIAKNINEGLFEIVEKEEKHG